MKAITLFYSRLLPWVMGCPEPLASQALLDSAIRFCEETGVITYFCQPQDVTADEGSYKLGIPTLQAVVVVQKVWYGTTLLIPAATVDVADVLAYTSTAGEASAVTGTPSTFFEVSPGVIRVYPVPEAYAANMISAKVATRPSRAATSLDDVLFEDWVDAVVAGARARLHSMPDQFFSNEAKATQAAQEFGFYINRAKGIAARGRVRTSRHVLPRRF